MKKIQMTKEDYNNLKDAANKYYKRHHSALHPSFITGVNYILKHIEIK